MSCGRSVRLPLEVLEEWLASRVFPLVMLRVNLSASGWLTVGLDRSAERQEYGMERR